MVYEFLLNNKFKYSEEYIEESAKFHILYEKETTSVFFNSKYIVIKILCSVNNENMRFQNLADYIIEVIKKKYGESKVKCEADWFIFFNNADIDMFNEYKTKQNKYYRGLLNSIWIFNNDGNIYFDPTKIQNKVIDARLVFIVKEWKKLIEKEKEISSEIRDNFETEMKHLFDVMFMMMEDSKFIFRPKVLK